MRGLSEAGEADVLVVGLGPAGASAAAVAARAGLRVIALDRKRSAGVPVQCAEFVPMALGGAAVTASTRQAIDAMHTTVEDDRPDLTEDFRGRMIDRSRFDAALVEEAIAAGADCRFGLALSGLDGNGIAHLSDGTTVAARVIIGADGPRSRAGAAIGCPNIEIVETRQVTVPLSRSHDATDIFLSASYPGGYAWLFPKGEVANLGLGIVPAERDRLKPLLEELRLRLVAEGRIGTEILGHTGGALPVGGRNRAYGRLGERLVLLAGDAAGLVNPVTGAGIPAAVVSGQMAGEAVAAVFEGGDLETVGASYAEDLGDAFDVSLSRALSRRRELLALVAAGHEPDKADLRRGWIAYPQYWAA